MESLGQRIRKRRKELRLTQKQVGKSVGVSAVSVTHWEGDETSPRGKSLHVLAKILRTTPDWLIYGKGSPEESWSNVSPGPEIQGKVPLISSVQAGMWSEIVDNFQPGDAEEWRETTAKVGKNAFALRVQGDSMVNPRGFPSIPAGAVVIVDPGVHPDSGKIVVARLDDTMEATIKKLVIDGPNRYLMPLNPDYRPIEINGNCTIVGVVKKVEFDL
jgi:SOS-response transcriptional repressor LexA